jgi:Amt family ammonium transporter
MKQYRSASRLAFLGVLLLGVLLLGAFAAQPAIAQEAAVQEAAAAANGGPTDVDYIWTIIAAALVFFMQAGFALLETGLTRAKNAVSIIMKNVMDVSAGAVTFFCVGFGLMFGPSAGGWIGTGGFFLSGLEGHAQTWTYAFFVFQAVFAATAVTIVSGAVAERVAFGSYLLFSVVVTGLIYPVFGAWAWGGLFDGGGWLESMGFIDFAGSTVVHSVGGWAALAGVLVVGPRAGKYDTDGTPQPIAGHSLPLAALGVFILWLGWFGFNAGSTNAGTAAIAPIALNTLLAAAAGAVGAMLTTRVKNGTVDAPLTLNGVLAGLVSITAGCATLSPAASLLTGAAAGPLMVFAAEGLERFVDDPVGAVAVHGVAGAWGTLAAGLFASSGFSPAQVGVQLVGIAAAFGWTFPLSYLLFYLIDHTVGLRIERDDEQEGLDRHEHDAHAYSPLINPALVDEPKFRQIAETIMQVFWVTSPGEREMHYVSPAYEKIWGRSREELYERPRSWLEAVHPADRARVRARLPERATGGYDEEYRITRPDGTVRWLWDRAFPVEGEDGDVERVVGVATDITERKKAEQALRRSEGRFRCVVENARDVIFQTDAEGRWTLLSPSWEEVMGYTVEESLGRCFTAYRHPDDRPESVAAYRRRVVGEDGAAEEQRIRYQTKGGATRWLRIRSRLLRDEAGEIVGATGTLTDVTDSVEVKAEREARKRAEDLLEAKTTFLNNMSHELRTPLSSILGFAEVLADEVNGPHREFARKIGQSGERLRNTLESILQLAKLEGESAADLDLTPLDVQAALAKAADAHRPAAEEKGLTFEVERPAEEDVRAPLDAGALTRILDNLIGNAVKFTDEGGVTLRLATERNRVRLSVADTGVGVAASFQEQLFEDFTQESTGLDRAHEGNGLGLAIVRRLTEQMKGTIDVTSAKGEGTTFTLSFPCEKASEDAPVDAAAAAPGETPKASPHSSAKEATLLIVEDNRNTRLLAEHMLASRYSVTSSCESEAAALVQQQRFDAFLIDIDLGSEEDGVALLRRLRALPNGAEAPAVAFTAHAMPGDERQYREAGFDDYLSKPFSREELLNIVQRALDGPA